MQELSANKLRDASVLSPRPEPQPRTRTASLRIPLLLLAGGLAVRVMLAYWTFLNPDEAWHYLLAAQPSLASAYRASLTTAHPPLMILLLYAWHFLGSSEFWLRVPSVLTGTAFCGMMFLWLDEVFDRTTALLALTLLLFSPPLISLSAEVRQYGLLLFFCSCSLYFLERALRGTSWRCLLVSLVSLYLALLTHYSALLFAFAAGVYGCLRFIETKRASRLLATWVAGQVVALGLTAFLVLGQVAHLRQSGLTKQISETYVSKSLFHPGHDHLARFMATNTLRLFRYFFSNGTIGVMGLLLFAAGLAILLAGRKQGTSDNRSPRAVAVLVVAPFVATLAAGIAALYPYGGTRHDVILAPFAMVSISVALGARKAPRGWIKPVAIAIPLAIGNLHPFPTGPYIRPAEQNRKLMRESLDYLHRAAEPGTTVLADYESGLLLRYYVCRSRVLDFDAAAHGIFPMGCGEYRLVMPDESLFVFSPETFMSTLRQMHAMHVFAGSRQAWLFQAGWIGDRQHLNPDDPELGCSGVQRFGRNISVCQINPAEFAR